MTAPSRFLEGQMTPLELVVDEPVPGHYYWMIVRPAHAGHAATIIDHAEGPLSSREASRAAGAAVFGSYAEAEARPSPLRTPSLIRRRALPGSRAEREWES